MNMYVMAFDALREEASVYICILMYVHIYIHMYVCMCYT